MPVPPPTMAIGEWPNRCSRASPIIVRSDPTCRLSAVGSNPMYAVMDRSVSRLAKSLGGFRHQPRHESSLKRSPLTVSNYIAWITMAHYARRPPLGSASQGSHVLPGPPARRQTTLATRSAVHARRACLPRRSAHGCVIRLCVGRDPADARRFHRAGRQRGRTLFPPGSVGGAADFRGGSVSARRRRLPDRRFRRAPADIHAGHGRGYSSAASRRRGPDVRPGDVCAPADVHVRVRSTSLSSLHAIEHIGLGRYNDPIPPDGWRNRTGRMPRVLAPGGRFYLGTPVGRERLNFNSGRVFDPRTIIDAIAAIFGWRRSPPSTTTGDSSIRPIPRVLSVAEYGCGLFEFIKP